MQLTFEKSRPGAQADYFPASPADEAAAVAAAVPAELRRKSTPYLPELGELEVIRHVQELLDRQIGIDSNFYPLGSCTMKYNPRVNETVARDPNFAEIHPFAPDDCAQGWLRVLYELQGQLCEIAGMDAFSLNTMAGAQGELIGLMLIKAYLKKTGQEHRDEIICPDAAHGTNPASAALVGFKVLSVKTAENGGIDIEALKKVITPKTAGLMLTNPSTLGLFETTIRQVAEIIHAAGGQLYYDGANLNAICGRFRPGDMGFDVVHLNLHKTMSTPHGGGGPGAGPVGVKKHLAPFLPVPYPTLENNVYRLSDARPDSVGRVGAFLGNAGILLRAYTYIKHHGRDGLPRNADFAVLNARYVAKKLSKTFPQPYAAPCMHEMVLQPSDAMLEKGVHTINVAKRLLDFGIHPPTIYFPLIVKEAIMIEPTETESLAVLNRFVTVMETIAKEALEDPQKVIDAPHTTPVKRVDETAAARNCNLCACG
ncbi:MAG: aminomethyl-transferring glycine dehydrogenase subunit GcvPB [Planctomycetota bacterium]